MFTDEDHIRYFDELEFLLKKTVIIYTDLLNELSDKSIKNKLSVLAQENMETFKFIKKQKEKFKIT